MSGKVVKCGNCIPDSFQNNMSVHCLDKEDRVRLSRLIIEGLEVALHLCNTFLNTFGPMRLIDILEQILPTAYVINTSYWPFYRTDTGFSTCICSIFESLNCPHSASGSSWIRLERPVNESVIFKYGNEIVTLKDLSVTINKYMEKQLYIENNSAGYKYRKTYEIQLEFKSKSSCYDGMDEYSEPVKCRLWFKFIKPKSDYNQFCICFTPHPIFIPIYGMQFTCLLDNLMSITYPGSLLVSWKDCPKFTIKITDKIFSKYVETVTSKDIGLPDDGKQKPQQQF